MKKVFTFIFALLSIFATTKAADLVFNVTVPVGTNSCWVVGNFNGWNNNQYKMNMVDATHYTLTVPESAIAAGVTPETTKYKYLSGGGDWAYVEKDAAGAEISDRSYVAPTNDVVLTWALVWKDVQPIPARVTIDVLVPLEVLQLYIVGTFNGWAIPTDTTKMTLKETIAEGKIYSINIFSPDLYKLQYKFCAGPAWDYEQTDSKNFQYPDVTQLTANAVVTSFKKYYDPSKVGDINITATVPAGTQRVWIMGSHLGWNWANLQEGTKNQDGTFSFVAKNVLSMEYRLYNWNTEWTNPEADDADPTKERPNRLAEYPKDANISITVSAWRNAAPNAIEMLDANKYKVYASQGTIVVEGVTSNVDVFDISGRNIESAALNGTFTSKTLKSGLYILRVDGETQKISVK